MPDHIDANGRWKLPPLILHPFANSSAPEKMAASSRAGLAIEGLVPHDEFTLEQLQDSVLDGRYSELVMLFYIGKDLLRWAGQCVEAAERSPGLAEAGVRLESFTHLLVNDPPENVDRKLRGWGVNEYRAIFSRSVGIHSVFAEVPVRSLLSCGFLRHYHHYADYMYACRERLHPWPELRSANFEFDMYASAEYTRMLEAEWNPGEA